MHRYKSFNLFLSLCCLARCPPSWMHYREVYRPSWLERFRFRIGLVMASNVQPWWTNGFWKRSPLMKMSTVFYKLMDLSYICSARMGFTKWALATVGLSGYVGLCVKWLNHIAFVFTIMTYNCDEKNMKDWIINVMT